MARRPTCVVPFQGDLAASVLVATLAREGREVIALSVAAGRLDPAALPALAARARRLGAAAHEGVDAEGEAYARFVTPLLQANVLRHGSDPLWAAAEPYLLAERAADLARRRGAEEIAHGADAADPDDAVRLEVALHALAPAELRVRAPIREEGLSPRAQHERLGALGLLDGDEEVRAAGAARSASGAWGGFAAGGALADPWAPPDDERHPESLPAWEAAELSEEFDVAFAGGAPIGAFGTALDGVNLVARLAKVGRRHAIGRLLHLGEDPLGLKRRTALEAPGAILLIAAHRALEQLTLTDHQLLLKEQLALQYADLLHRGLYHEPVMRDLEAFFASTQVPVTGRVRLRVYRGALEVIGVESERSLLAAAGPAPSARDAEGHARTAAAPSGAARRAGAPPRTITDHTPAP